jgi:hypothetical protein
MGLLDNFDDPMTQGLLSAGFSGLQAAGPSFKPMNAGSVLGAAGNAGLTQYIDSNNYKKALKIKEEENQLKRDTLMMKQANEYGTTPFVDAKGNTFLIGKDGSIKDVGIQAQPKDAITQFEQAKLAIERQRLGLEAQRAQSALDQLNAGKVPMGYRMTREGNLEAIPGGPADQKALNQIAGKDSLSTAINDLRSNYEELQAKGGIVDKNAPAASNILAGISSSGLGQAAGNLIGTDNQSTRNKINMARPLLLQSIKNATGMSAKQMDSNAELKLWLATATDPTKDIAANLDALDRIEKTYGGAQQPSNSSNMSGSSTLQAKPQMSAQDQEALTWAKANAFDPRAKAIKQRLGVQ